MSITHKFTLLISLIVIIIFFIFSSLHITLQEKEYISGVDEKLYTAAIMAKSILPENYHNNIVNKSSINEEEYLSIINRFNILCVELGLQYLWSNMIVDEDIVFTSSTSTSGNIKNSDHALFFDKHSDPGSFSGVISSNNTHYSTFTNEWGKGRMVLIPFRDSLGRSYFFGASISISELDDRLEASISNSVGLFIIFLIISFIITYIFSHSISHPIRKISNLAESIAAGDYGKQIDIHSAVKELKVLSESINNMSTAIKSHDDELLDVVSKKTTLFKESESYISSIIANTVEGVVTIDESGIIEVINPAAENILGYTPAEIVGKNISVILPDRSKSSHSTYLNHPDIYLNKIRDSHRKLEAKKKDGSVFPIELAISKMEISRGDKYIALFHDISKQEEYEKNLLKAKEGAEKANNAKSLFLSSMSHELRTPLNAILGFSQLLLDDPSSKLEDADLEAIQYIYDGGKTLLSLIDDVLDLSKVEIGGLNIDMEKISINKEILHCIKEVSPFIKKYGIKVNFNNSPDMTIVVDRNRFRGVLTNLFSNAIKYNKAGGLVSIYHVERPAGRVRIYIKDTGLGIAEKDKDRVFEPFQRIGLEKTVVEGSGIGLTIAKKMVKAMGGMIGFDSKQGEGTTFWIEFPFLEHGYNYKDKIKAIPFGDVDVSANKKVKALYVEDNPAHLELMRQVVRLNPSIHLLTANTASKGINIAIKEKPSIILMDIDLPDMDGISALRKIYEIDELKNMPAIAISGGAMDEDIERANKAGFDSYITKPYKIHELLDRIQELTRSGKFV